MPLAKDSWRVTVDGVQQTLRLVPGRSGVTVFMREGSVDVTIQDPLNGAFGVDAVAGGLTAPMPGKVVALRVAVGDRVAAGDVLAVMEAMKMEHTILAPGAGVVTDVFFQPGEQVAEGDALLQLESES